MRLVLITTFLAISGCTPAVQLSLLNNSGRDLIVSSCGEMSTLAYGNSRSFYYCRDFRILYQNKKLKCVSPFPFLDSSYGESKKYLSGFRPTIKYQFNFDERIYVLNIDGDMAETENQPNRYPVVCY